MAASTQNQALSAILFLYKEVLHMKLDRINHIHRAKRGKKLPVVFTKEEVQILLKQLSGIKKLMASLLYGCGLRLNECLKLRVKDIDFGYYQITIHDAKGHKDRITMLPHALITPLKEHLIKVKQLRQMDLKNGFGEVYLPDALAKKYSICPTMRITYIYCVYRF